MLPYAGSAWYDPLRPHLMGKVHHVAGGVHQRRQQPQRAQQAVEGDAVIKGHHYAQGRLAQPGHRVAADGQQDQGKDDLVGLKAGPAGSCTAGSCTAGSWAVQAAGLRLAGDVRAWIVFAIANRPCLCKRCFVCLGGYKCVWLDGTLSMPTGLLCGGTTPG